MNKLLAMKPDGSAMLALELDPANLHCLKQNKPILLDLNGLFPDGIPPLQIVISYTETPVATARAAEPIASVLTDDRTPAACPHCPECRSTVESVSIARNMSPLAVAFCPVCGCFLGLVANELTRGMTIKDWTASVGNGRTQ